MYKGSAERGGVIIFQTETHYLLENTKLFFWSYFKNQI